jgi:hypothetical protein
VSANQRPDHIAQNWQRNLNAPAISVRRTHINAPLGVKWKRGEQKKAIGRSRGGRNTKIHAIADAKGRLLSIPLTGGQAHAVRPVASHTRTPLGTGIIDVAPR